MEKPALQGATVLVTSESQLQDGAEKATLVSTLKRRLTMVDILGQSCAHVTCPKRLNISLSVRFIKSTSSGIFFS